MSMSNSMYGYRRCCGDHFHVTGAGEDLIGGRFETEAEAKGAADLLNAGATLDSALVGTDAPKPAPSPHGQDVEALVRAGTHVVVSTREWAYALQAMGIPEDRWQPDTLRSRPVEPEPVACFFRLIRLHSHEVSADRIAEHRVPPGTRLVGRLYIAPDGELVVTDGWPNDEVADEDPYVHNCDEMGCSTVSHVIARLASPVAPREEKPE